MRKTGGAGKVRAGVAAGAAAIVLWLGVAELAAQAGRGMRGPMHDVAHAPPPARMASRVDRHVAMLEGRLGLEAAQTELLRAVFADHFSAMEAIHRYRSGTDRDAHMEQMTALWRGTDSRVAEILTPEQKERYLEWRAGHGPGNGMGARRAAGGRMGPPAGTGARRRPPR